MRHIYKTDYYQLYDYMLYTFVIQVISINGANYKAIGHLSVDFLHFGELLVTSLYQSYDGRNRENKRIHESHRKCKKNNCIHL